MEKNFTVVYEPLEDVVNVNLVGAIVDKKSSLRGTKIHKILYEDFKNILEKTVDSSKEIQKQSENIYAELIDVFGQNNQVFFPSDCYELSNNGDLIQLIKGNSKFPSVIGFKDDDEFSYPYPMCTRQIVVKSKMKYLSPTEINVSNIECFIFTGIMYKKELESDNTMKFSESLTTFLKETFEGRKITVDEFNIHKTLRNIRPSVPNSKEVWEKMAESEFDINKIQWY